MNIVILGVNGFIGSHLAERILKETDWMIWGFDLSGNNICQLLEQPRFQFVQGDIFRDDAIICEHVVWSDVVVPLVGKPQPALYNTNPLLVFELNFEQNLKVVRMCNEYDKRIIFPSTSEVYGLSNELELKEDSSLNVLGPINESRWIYSCSKQLMDRVIAAYGQQHGLRYTCFRPFNWIGPRLDSFDAAKKEEARVITQFIYNLINGKPVILVNGGNQRRSFTYVDDGIAGLLAIIRNEGNRADSQIFNLGNPRNNHSIKDLAYMVRDAVAEYPAYRELARSTPITDLPAKDYYGVGYADVADRLPSIEKAARLLGWAPRFSTEEAIRRIVAYYLGDVKK